ncbi:DUF5685 family protein [Streptomyces sp. HPF1205]|uniref:DUF5685 family protein n=1 Tax=Streptomyces sp. HPF1205 TaxID=2873262 RepID=UPI001CECDE25|nr:DUF5685 family protein [Streptomyces sp. HPF1205]
MFGIIRPCRHRMSEGMAASWVAHLCGLCLALRDGHGQFARVATNYDGLVISVLVEAQSAPAPDGRRTAGPCPLRGMRTAPVATGEGARLAAAVSLALASAKVRDHVEDGDGVFGRRPVAAVARGVVRRWDTAGARTGGSLGFDTAVLLDAVGRQGAVEAAARPGTPLLAVTEPTEAATAAAFGHTAVLAGRPGNKAALEEAGRLFGRLAHLLDAVEDLAADARSGAWNPLTATGTGLPEARRLCDDAVHGVHLALKDVEFTGTASGKLAHMLLVHELRRSVDRAFGGGTCSHRAPGGDHGAAVASDGNPYGGSPYGPGSPYAPGNPYAPGGPGAPGGFPPPEPPRRRGPLAGCLVWTGLCCTCQLCCREHNDPWSGERRGGWCRDCDLDCDCCDCCECCECLECCDCGGC